MAKTQEDSAAPREDAAALLEKVVIGGDLSKLTPAERMDYYGRVCESIGLNPLTRPFEYLTLNGRLVLYARRDAADQLRKVNRISITRVDVAYQDDLIVVTVAAQDAHARSDTDVGVVSMGNARGEARANLILKAVTKGKRRVTLSICGLGVLDETEVDSIPGARRYEEMGVPVAVDDDGAVVLDQTALPSAPTPDRPAPPGVRVAPTPNGPASGGQTTLDRVAGEFAAAPADGQPPGRSVSVEEAKAALKEACLRIGLPAPVTLREVNTLAREHGVDVVGSSAGVTAPWLDRIRAALPDIPVGPLDREHMSDKANALTALRATCKALGRPDGEPGSLDALNALATEAGMGIVASWDTATAGWLEAIQRHLVARPGTGATEAPTQRHTTEAQSQRTEQSLAGWIAAAPDRATLEQLSSDVHRAHEAGFVSQGVAEALLEAVDARTAELDLYGAGAAAAGERGAASAEQSGAQEVEAATAG